MLNGGMNEWVGRWMKAFVPQLYFKKEKERKKKVSPP